MCYTKRFQFVYMNQEELYSMISRWDYTVWLENMPQRWRQTWRDSHLLAWPNGGTDCCDTVYNDYSDGNKSRDSKILRGKYP